MKLLFCDDDTIFLDMIIKCVSDEVYKHSVNAQLIGYISGEEMFAQNEYLNADALFLDIDMPGMTGFYIAEQLGKMTHPPVIIFISNKDQLVFESFSYHPFWFLRKSDLQQMPEVVEKLIAYIQTEKYIFHFEMRKQRISVSLKDIRYFENDNHYVTVHATAASYKYKASIGDISKELSAFYFVRPHVGFLVNCRYISTLRKNALQLISGEIIPIARNRMKETQKQFIIYTRSIHI